MNASTRRLFLSLSFLVAACGPIYEAPLPVECVTDEDCAAADACAGVIRCVSSQCLALAPRPDGDCCGDGLAGTCQAGTCVDLGESCWDWSAPPPDDPEAPSPSCPPDRVLVDGVCRALTCGDGEVQPGEACDDGNDVSGDGCEGDCTFTCVTHADCDDGDACNGEERCAVDHTCLGLPPPPDGTLCESPYGTCLSGRCEPSVCGDGEVDPRAGETCDDGNLVDGDGCDADCTWSCTRDAECDDGRLCTGAEWCHLATHTCQPGSPAPDGLSCGLPGAAAELCLQGVCVPAVCGDGFVEPASEACDDGNLDDGDGCDADCTWSCVQDSDCDDGVWCNGGEFCDDHVCQAGPQLPDGTLCATGRTCRAGACAPYYCGDGVVDAGEECDDGNRVDADGCEADCTWSCVTDADCDDHNACNGAELCHPATRTCVPGPVPDCDDGDLCTLDTCQPSSGCLHRARDTDRDGVSCRLDCNDGDASLGEARLWATDCDGDGFAPADATLMAACTRPTVGACAWIPYNPKAVDCADRERLAHPGQYRFFSNPYRTPEGLWSFDYDCNGRDEERYPARMIGCSDDCEGGGWRWAVPRCGGRSEWRACSAGWFSCGEKVIEETQTCR